MNLKYKFAVRGCKFNSQFLNEITDSFQTFRADSPRVPEQLSASKTNERERERVGALVSEQVTQNTAYPVRRNLLHDLTVFLFSQLRSGITMLVRIKPPSNRW